MPKDKDIRSKDAGDRFVVVASAPLASPDVLRVIAASRRSSGLVL